jgi:hypothetical protein
MSGLEPNIPGSEAHMARNPDCLDSQNVPPVCLRLHSHRQRLALPYALLLRAELSEDETNCAIIFATHEVNVRGRHLLGVYLAVSQGQAVQISIGDSASFAEGDKVLGPLITDIRIEPTDESGRARR